MCGIVGVIAKKSKRLIHYDFEIFSNLLIADAVRGKDSTGIFYIDHLRNVDYLKLASHPFNLLSTTEYNTWRGEAFQKGQVLVGHNRKATEGTISNENSHPFISGPITLVHNGHISNFRTLVPIKVREKHGINVDSHGIAYLISKGDHEQVLKELRGAFAIVWFDSLKKKLFLIRNSERPLAMMESENSFYFASEGSMIKWSLKRHKIAPIPDMVGQIKPNTLIEIDLSKDELSAKDFVVKPIDLPVVVTRVYNVSNDINDDESTQIGVEMRRAIQDVWRGGRHKPVKLSNDDEIKESASFPRTLSDSIPIDKRFNIHYGHDRPIFDMPGEFQQIIWTIESYRLLKTEPNGNKIYQVEGSALKSKKIKCIQGLIMKNEEEMENLAAEMHLISFVKRVRESSIWQTSEKFSTVQTRVDGMEVVVSGTKPVNLIELGSNKLLVTEEHAKEILESPACLCDMTATKGKKDPNGNANYSPTSNAIIWQCEWCVNATEQLEKHDEIS